MPLIKSANTPANVSTFSMTDIESHARLILLRASHQAEQLLAAAQTEADLLHEHAKTDGYAEGLAAGKREGVAQGKAEGETAGRQAAFDAEKDKCDSAFAALSAMLTAFDAERERVIAMAESDVMPLALAIARKVTRRLGEVDPGVVEANLREAVRLINGPHDIRVAVNSGQLTVVEALLPRLRQQWPALHHVTITGDDAIVAGGCRVNTAGGEIDADLDQQLNRLIEELVGVATGRYS